MNETPFPQNNIRKKDFILILVLLIVAGVISWNLYFKEYRQKDTVDITAFPKTIKDWTSEELPVTEEEYSILETRNVVARKYTSPQKKQVYFLMVYSQNNRKVSHPPEVCYTGSGVTIIEKKNDVIPVHALGLSIEANRLLLEGRGAQQFSFYWFKVGDTFTPNYWKQQLLIAVKTIFGKPCSSALIRVSADVVDGNQEESIGNVKEFTRMVTADIFKYLP